MEISEGVIRLGLYSIFIIIFRGGSRGRVQGVRTPPRDDLRFSNTTGILPKKKRTMWFIGVEVEQETSAPPPKKNPGSAPDILHIIR